MRILVNQHDGYNYMDSSLIQGFSNLGHEVESITPGTNYVQRQSTDWNFDLFVQFINNDDTPYPDTQCVFVWGEDDNEGLDAQFAKGFDHVFVRDHVPGQPGHPINFAIEDRYYCITSSGYKPLKDREIDVCFLGQPYPWRDDLHRYEYTERLKNDFPNLNLMFGDRTFEEPDDKWSKWTQPFCVHDPRYFEILANSKICLSFHGYGPDCGRHYESMASGGICLIEDMQASMVSDADVYWFMGYDDLASTVDLIMKGIKDDPEGAQEACDYAWKENRSLHSTAARAQYLLDAIGMGK